MTSEFRKGQLVAVRDTANSAWHLRVYDHASPEGLYFCRGLERQDAPCWWSEVCSAEVVWPDIFLARDRVIIELLQEMRLRLHQGCEEYEENMVETDAQIWWLCSQLAIHACPARCPQEMTAKGMEDKPCPDRAECWRKRAVEKVKEDDADAPSEKSPALGR